MESIPLDELKTLQREAAEDYRAKYDSDKSVGVGWLGPERAFPVRDFLCIIDEEGRSFFMLNGGEVDERPRPEPTATAEPAETTTVSAEETVGTTRAAAETTTGQAVETDADVADRVASVERFMREVEATPDRSAPTISEIDSGGFRRVAEETTTERTTSTATESVSSSRRALGVGSQQRITVNNPVSLGAVSFATNAGTISFETQLGLDYPFVDNRTHAAVQKLDIMPNTDDNWRIQSAETVHDWRTGYPTNMRQHEPVGLAGGPKFEPGLSVGVSGPSITWDYSQPDVTRKDLSESRKAKWRWRWNRAVAGQNAETFVVGSLATAFEEVAHGDLIMVVRAGATFKKGFFGPRKKVAIALEFHYE